MKEEEEKEKERGSCEGEHWARETVRMMSGTGSPAPRGSDATRKKETEAKRRERLGLVAPKGVRTPVRSGAAGAGEAGASKSTAKTPGWCSAGASPTTVSISSLAIESVVLLDQ